MPRPVEKLYVKTNYMGYIAALQMMGPIVTPMQVSLDQAVLMLKSGMRNLFEYNPTTKQTRLLTIVNVGKPWPGEAKNDVPAAMGKTAPASSEPVVLTGAPVPPAKEETPQTATEVVETTPGSVADQFNANEGLIDESKVDWNSMTKAQRREMRAKIDAQKAAQAAAAKEAETASDETTVK